jgi:hypothetical protein
MIATHRTDLAVETWLIAVPHMSGASVSFSGEPETSDRYSGTSSSAHTAQASVHQVPVRAARNPSRSR